MGNRPNMYLVFGVDNYDQPIDSVYIDDCDLSISEQLIKEQPFTWGFVKSVFYNHRLDQWREAYDALYYDNGSYTNGQYVVGMILNHSYNSDIVRTLSVFHPEYLEGGRRDIPLLDKNKHPFYANRINPILASALGRDSRCQGNSVQRGISHKKRASATVNAFR